MRHLPAFVLGILGWKSRAGKAAVMVTVLLLLLDVCSSYLQLSLFRTSQPHASFKTSGAASVPEIESVVVSRDKAIVKQRDFHGEGMIITFGTMTNRWEPGSLYFDNMFDVTMEFPWVWGHSANWVFKTRHGTYWDYYKLDGPAGPMVGKLVFHSGKPAPEADGSYVIGEFRPETGAPLPIAVRLVADKPAQRSAAPVGSPVEEGKTPAAQRQP